MACTFDINITGSADSFVASAKSKVEENGGTFTGDASSGNFDVPLPLGQHISGDYAINGLVVSINITHKPFVISCGAIESYINSHI